MYIWLILTNFDSLSISGDISKFETNKFEEKEKRKRLKAEGESGVENKDDEPEAKKMREEGEGEGETTIKDSSQE
jgi:hypothetical protein